jgi:glycerol-3-phosphate acyltransferase PlsX
MRLVSDGRAKAVVTAGNTGAMMAFATLLLNRLPNIKRPGIAVNMPTRTGTSLLIDAGANIKCKPEHLVQYAVMAHIYCKHVIKKERPTVGLLNIGTEDVKGNDLVKETLPLLQKLDLNIIGYVEGYDIFNGKCDIIVCEGFVGNAILKACEGMASTMFDMLKQEAKNSLISGIGAMLFKPALMRLKAKTGSAEYGGALLLGVDGVCIKSHGSAGSESIHNAIKAANRAAKIDINGYIIKELPKEEPDNTIAK